MNKYLIKDLMNVNRGSSPRPIIEYLSESGYRWLKISDFNLYDRFVYETKEFIKESGLKNTRYLPAGTLILTNSATPGIPIFLGRDMCLHDGFLYFTNIKENIININYLYYWFLYNRKLIINQANGSVFKNLKKDIVENFEITVPDMNTQLKIVKILDDINGKLELNNKINNNLYKISQKIYNQWFVEFEYPINSKETYKTSGGKFKEVDGKLIPEEFTICNLDEICDCQNGHAFYKEGYDDYGLMVIDLGNVSLQGNFIYTNADKFISRERIPNEKFIVKKNDLVMIMTDRKATMDLLGKTAKIYEDKEYALNQRIYRIRPRINVNYVYSFLNSDSTLDKLKGVALGSVQKYVNTNHINELRILVPSDGIMSEYSKIVDSIFRRMEENILENKNFEIIRDILLPRLMSGEIDLNNLEI